MSKLSYAFSGNYEWHGIFVFTVEAKRYQAGGTLVYKSGTLFQAEIVLGEYILSKFSKEQIYTVYCFLKNKKTKELSHCTLLNCLICAAGTVWSARGQTVTSLRLMPRFALFSSSFYNTEVDSIESLSVEYNTWPEFNYPQGFKSSKQFQNTHWNLDLKDGFSLSSHETIQINPLSAKDFKAEEIFIGTDDELQKISDALRPILEQSGDYHIEAKVTETHRWCLCFKCKEGVLHKKELQDFIEKIWEVCQLLYILTHDKNTSPVLIELNIKQNDAERALPYTLLYTWSGVEDKARYENMLDALNMGKIGIEAMKTILNSYFEKYDYLADFLRIMWHNNKEEAFSIFHVSRIIDCWARIAGEKGFSGFSQKEKDKYQKIFEWWVGSDTELIKKVEELSGEQKDKIGEKISTLRANVVHFVPGATNYDVIKYFEIYPFLELAVIDYIFEKIGLSVSLRNEYKKQYLCQ